MNDEKNSARRPARLAAAALMLALNATISFAQALESAQAPHAPAEATDIKLDTITVQRGDLQQTVDAVGKLQFRQYADVNVQVAGQIKDVLFAVGDAVQEGKLVIE